jgi:hypothetical protein
MKVILTESRFNTLLKENYKEKVGGSLMNLSKFSNKVVRDASNQLKFDFRFLVTYGAGIGSILQSVFDYLEGNFTGLSETQLAGLAVMAVGVVFFENKDLKSQIKNIESMGLSSELDNVVSYTQNLKNKFSNILSVLGLSIHRTSNIISYSFLIPLLSIIIEIVTLHGVESSQFSMLIESLLTSGLIAVEGVALRDILMKAGDIISQKTVNQK